MSRPSPTCQRCAGTGWVWLSTEEPARMAAVEISCPVCCAPPAQVVADWRQAHHWCPTARPCRHCAAPTHLRDDDGFPAHKICNENATEIGATTPARVSGGGR